MSEASPERTGGRFRCPACEARFDKVRFLTRDPGKPWYHLWNVAPACPRCKALLRDQRIRIGSYLTDVAVLIIIMVYFVPAWREPAVTVVVALAVGSIAGEIYMRRKFTDETRYARLGDG